MLVPILMAIGCPLTVTISDCPTDAVDVGTVVTLGVSTSGGQGVATWGTEAFNATVADGTTAAPTVTATGGDIVVTVGARDEADALASDTCTINVNTPACMDNAGCDDADACNGSETCVDGACVDGTAVVCADGEACVDGACVSTCTDATECDDGDACTDDACTDGACANTTTDCDDGDACTDDSCDSATGCANEATDCDDSLDCTDDSCDTDTGCVNANTCDAATPICTAAGCVECEADTDCAADETCEANVCESTVAACTVDADCADDSFCNGDETCDAADANADAQGCVAGTRPCDDEGGSATETCSEDTQVCTSLTAGSTFNFTTEIDALGSTAFDDIYRGVSSTINPTLSAGDAANGGAGDDELQVFLTTADLGPGIAIDNIEKILAQNTTSTARTISVLGWTGVDELWSDNSQGMVTFTGMTELMVVGLLSTAQDVTATFNSAALTGTGATADTVTVELDGAQNGADIVIGSTNTADGVETIVVNSGGDSANRIDGIDDGGENDLTALTLQGDQDLRIDGPIGTSVKTIDASALTGDADVSVGGLTAFTYTGTDQDDTIRATNIGATDNIDGGDGSSDSLIVSGTFAAATITGVEALTLQPTVATPTFALTNATGITSVTVEPTVLITDLDGTGLAPNTTITIDSDLAVTLGGADSDFALLTPAGAADSLALVFTGNSDVTIDGGGADINVESYESVSMTFNNNGTLTFAAGDVLTDTTNNLVKVTLASTGGLDTATSAGLLSTSTAFNELDATGVVGVLLVDAANFPVGSVMRIDSGGGNDVIITNTGATTVNSGGGNDTITGAAGADIIDGGAGIDVIDGSTGVDSLTGGTEADTFRFDNSVANGTPAAADSVTDWEDGTDLVEISSDVGDFDGGTGLASGGGAAASLPAQAVGTMVVTSIAQSAGATAVGGTDFLKLTTGVDTGASDQATFNAAIGTSTVTGLTASTGTAGSFYDTLTNQMVLFEVASDLGVATSIETGDTIRVIARIAMTAAEYTTFTTADILSSDF